MPSEPTAERTITDVPYVRQFCPELNPSLLRAVAALAGCPPPPGEDFDYGELGSGNGDTLATLAAAYPRARFVGIDLHPGHVAAARELSSRGELANVRFLERDFEDIVHGELPKLDYLSAHGLLTWIAPEKRASLFARAAECLKPGGLLYLGYNALPGWAAVEPLRRFLLDAARNVEGGSEARVRHALAAAKLLCDANAEYFVANPGAKEILGKALEFGVPYAANELFGPHFRPAYFADVAEQAAAYDLRFVGQLPLHLNYGDLTLAPALREAFRPVTERRAWEHLKAFATNEFFRRDVYVKGAVSHAENTTRTYLETTAFGTLVPASEVKRVLTLPDRSLPLTGPLFEGLIGTLAARATTLAELATTPPLADFGVEGLRKALLQLIMGKDVIPMRSPAPEPVVSDSRYQIPSAFNRAVLSEPVSKAHAVVLASPVAGTGVGISRLQGVLLRALTEASPEDRSGWIRAFAEANPLRIWDHGRTLNEKAELSRVVEEQLEPFSATWLPKLIELGVIAPSAAAAT